MIKRTWRLPGQPYTIEVDGLKIKCKPLSKEEQIKLREVLINHKPTLESLETLEEAILERIISIEGVDKIDEFISYNLNKLPLLISCILTGDAITEVEEKNSESSSG